MTGLELTIERSYQTNSPNIHLKITGLVRRFSRRRNCPQGGYIVVNIILTKECRKKCCPFLVLENSRPLSPLREPQTHFSSSGTPDFLSTCLEIDSHLFVIYFKYRGMDLFIPNSLTILYPHPSPPGTVSLFYKNSGMLYYLQQVFLNSTCPF